LSLADAVLSARRDAIGERFWAKTNIFELSAWWLLGIAFPIPGWDRQLN